MTTAIPMLQPVAALLIWTLIVFFWMIVTRGAAARAAGINLMASRGGRGGDLQGRIPDRANWVAHNHNHLMEQPTLFYAVALALALLGDGSEWSIRLAWLYVVARVVHSLIQGLDNLVARRFAAFAVATTALGVLVVRLALAVF